MKTRHQTRRIRRQATLTDDSTRDDQNDIPLLTLRSRPLDFIARLSYAWFHMTSPRGIGQPAAARRRIKRKKERRALLPLVRLRRLTTSRPGDYLRLTTY